LFNSKDTQEINRKLVLYQKLREQQQDLERREKIAEEERIKIDLWWEQEKKKIVPWTDEQRADYEKITWNTDKPNKDFPSMKG